MREREHPFRIPYRYYCSIERSRLYGRKEGKKERRKEGKKERRKERKKETGTLEYYSLGKIMWV